MAAGAAAAGVMATTPAGWAVAGTQIAATITAAIVRLAKGCGAPCVGATTYANQAEALLKQNLEAYRAGQIIQSQAIANFDAVWGGLVAACRTVAGSPGQRCITERQRGGTAPWCSTGTGCDWFILYRDPLGNPATITETIASTEFQNSAGFFESVTQAAGIDSRVKMAAIGGAVVLGLLLLRKGGD